jgi:tripartite-type tricarboxylate transporter receptor subunit TctC
MNEVRSVLARARRGSAATGLALALLLGAAQAGTAAAASPASAAASWPVKPLRLLVGFAAGGAVDLTARVMAQRMSERLSQPIVVDVRPGSSGNIASLMLAQAPGDGYTIHMATGINAVSATLFKDLRYDPLRDFAPIMKVVDTTSVLVVTNTLPVKTVAELVAYARANPGKLNYATTGSGSSPHLAAALFSLMAGVEMVHVPYKGGPQTIQELMGGAVQLSFANIAVAIPPAKAGRLRALAVTGAKRTALWPELPTVAESGFPGYQVDVWYGLVAPAKTPRAIIERLHREGAAVLAMPEVREQLASAGLEPAPSTPAELAAVLAADVERYAKLIRAAKIQPD